MTRQVNDSIVVARSYGTKRKANELHLSSHDIEYCYYCSEWWSKGESWEQHCLGHLREEVNCYGAWTYGSAIIRPAFCPFCWQDDSLKPSQRMQSWNRNQDAARHIRDSHTCPLECRQCSTHLQSMEGIFSHLRDLHDWDLRLTFQGGCASSPRTASPDIATTPTLRASCFEKNNLHKSNALDTAIATHQGPGDTVQPSGPYGDVRAESSVLGMQSSIRPADTSAEFPSSQAPKSPMPQERNPSISEPEETLPPKKRVRLVYKNKLVCSFLA